VAENKEVPDSNIGVPPVRKYANYRTLDRTSRENNLVVLEVSFCGNTELTRYGSYWNSGQFRAGRAIQYKQAYLERYIKLFQNTPSDRLYQVEAEDADTGMSKSVLYSFTDECKLADCEVRDDQ
jgi:hypothetical protein